MSEIIAEGKNTINCFLFHYDVNVVVTTHNTNSLYIQTASTHCLYHNETWKLMDTDLPF